MSEISKQICSGLHLKIIKRLSNYLIDFLIENTTDYVFLFHFLIKDQVNVKTFDDEMEKKVQILPNTKFTFMQLQILGSFSYKYEYKYQKLCPEPIIKQVEVCSDVNLIINQQDMEQRIVFELENNTNFAVHFELTVLELSGIRTFNGKTLFSVDINANNRTDVCELYFDGVWSYKYSFVYTSEDPSSAKFSSSELTN